MKKWANFALSPLRPAFLVIALAIAHAIAPSSVPAFGISPALAQADNVGFQLGLRAFEQNNFNVARQYWLPLADDGLADAQLGMGVLVLEGLGTAQDDAQAARWFALSAEQGNAEAQYNLGFLLFSGRGVQQDLSAAHRWFDAAADQGHADANYYLGTMHSGGYGADRDEVLAYSHFQRAFVAAAAGDLKQLAARSRDALGRRLNDADLARARQLAESAARPAAPAQAAQATGQSYADGIAAYEAEQFAAALQIWQPLATGGDGLAQQGLGVLYHDGLGTAPSKTDAAKWFARAARQGLAESQYNLGLLLFAGEGIAKNQQAAARWFGLAGDQGHPEANYYLGTVLAGGADGIAQDDEAAYHRYLLANDSNPEPTLAVLIRQGLDTVSRRLSADQIARAEQAQRDLPAAAPPTAPASEGQAATSTADLRATQKAAQDRLAAAQRQAAQLADATDEARSEYAAFQGDLAALDRDFSDIERQLANGRAERDQSRTTLDAAEDEVAKTETALQSEQQRIAQAARTRATADDRIATLTQQLAAARAARQTALEAEATAAKRAERLVSNVEDQQRRARRSQDELDSINALLAEAEQAQEQLAGQRDQVSARLAQLDDDLAVNAAAEAALQAQIDAASSDVQQVEQQIAAFQAAPGQAPVAAVASAQAAPEAPSPERPETRIAVAQELQEQAVAAAERNAPPPSTELVSALQTSLGQLGYDPGPADGIFGAKTVDAVKQFQAEQGLPETGIVTQELAFLLSLLAERDAIPPAVDLALAGSGTGFVVTDNGHILTNNHVVEACQEVRLNYDGEDYVVDHVSSDPQADLALLDGRFTADDIVFFRGGRGIRPGEDVVALGYPLQGRLSDTVKVTKGTISALSGPGNDRTLIQTTAPVQAGSSGGPLLDMSGNLVGIVVGKISSVDVENVSFAINGSIARIFLDAEGVRYTTLRSEEALSAADVAEQGRRATVLIECWNPVG